MRTITVSGKERTARPKRSKAAPAVPSDAPLAIVYAAIICCALMAMLVLAVARSA